MVVRLNLEGDIVHEVFVDDRDVIAIVGLDLVVPIPPNSGHVQQHYLVAESCLVDGVRLDVPKESH